MSNDYATGNFPTQGDSTHITTRTRRICSPAFTATSEGGYGSANPFSPQNQRHADPQPPKNGLVDQSLDGGALGSELQDAKQGTDQRSREQFTHEARRDFDGALDPYGRNPDSKEEMGERLASAYADKRGQQYESSGAAGNDSDVGAL
ncbi:hypothetical protein OH76DRAFT_1411747 [Lentinus brumalis]|uniref:Uncharacterized protein n=1 Tax=Lentinus brumalis TaxID=2498619 RepID=A0A371CNH2_9APHY|nr:hypothetical protein OH76DRAFT_1411747 [Polyporus brumalis]